MRIQLIRRTPSVSDFFALNNACHASKPCPSSAVRTEHAASSLQSSANRLYNLSASTLCSSFNREMLKSWVTVSSTLRSSSAMSPLTARTATVKLYFQLFNADFSSSNGWICNIFFASMKCDTFAAQSPVSETLGLWVLQEARCALAPKDLKCPSSPPFAAPLHLDSSTSLHC